VIDEINILRGEPTTDLKMAHGYTGADPAMQTIIAETDALVEDTLVRLSAELAPLLMLSVSTGALTISAPLACHWSLI
jgi:hypothetical protein